MEPFATVSDVEKRWRTLSDIEKNRAEALLSDASVIVKAMCDKHGIEIKESDEIQALTIEMIVCEMVKRAMLSPVDEVPVSQKSKTAGPYSESFTYVNPTGDLYITKSEQTRLGIGRQRMFSIQPMGGVANEG